MKNTIRKIIVPLEKAKAFRNFFDRTEARKRNLIIKIDKRIRKRTIEEFRNNVLCNYPDNRHKAELALERLKILLPPEEYFILYDIYVHYPLEGDPKTDGARIKRIEDKYEYENLPE